MPIYDYLCAGCGSSFEVRATISEKARGLDVACPECHSKEVTQQFGSVIFIRGGSSPSDAARLAMPPSCGPLRCGPGTC